MEELSRECLMETLDVYSGLKRIGGSEDEHRACGYLIKKLQEWGIPCRVYECDGYVSTPIEASVTVEGMDQTFEALPRSFSAHCPDGVTAPLFYDVHAHDQLKPRQEQDWYAGARGCIVIGDNFYEDYVQKLRGYGVKGLIHLWTSEEPVLHYETVSPVWGTAEPENGKTYPDFPVVGLRSCDRESILPLLTPGACSRTATVRSVLQCGCVRLQIPVAELAGETPEYVLVGSHYDSWDYGVTDNATGNAAVLELARVLSQKQLRRGVKIAWWPAHSNGRYAGSTWYCDEQFEDLDARCVALVNMDSPGCMGAQEIGFSTSGVAGDTLGDILRRCTGQAEVVIRPLGRGSDLSFFGPRIPIQVSFDFYQAPPNRGRWHCAGSGGGWWWHSVEDTMDKVDPQLLMRDTRVLVELVKEFADEAHLPFDAAGCLAQMRDTVADIRTHCGDDFDFAPVERALEELDKACAGRICFSSDRQAKEAGGRLTRLLCSACDEYHFDNTFAVGLLPGLQLVRGKHRNDLPPQEFLYWRTAFRRQVNRFVSECTSIVQALNSDADSVV